MIAYLSFHNHLSGRTDRFQLFVILPLGGHTAASLGIRVDKMENYAAQQERVARRDAQRRAFHRNQAIGLLLAAAALLAWRLFHTPTGWLFPQGWWRLW